MIKCASCRGKGTITTQSHVKQACPVCMGSGRLTDNILEYNIASIVEGVFTINEPSTSSQRTAKKIMAYLRSEGALK